MRRMTIVAVAATLALVVAACTPSVTVENTGTAADGTAGTGISVSGTGNVTGTPDTLTISFGVTVRRDTVSEAVSVAAERADAIIAVLIDGGISEEDIQTINYSIHPEYDYRNDAEELIGYRVSNTVRVKIRDTDSAGALIDDVATAGGNEVTVSGVSFSIEDNEELIEAARGAAWNDALSKAQQLADLSGVALGDPISIEETFSTEAPPIAFRDQAIVEFAAVDTPISPGTQKVAVTLAVQFSIDD